MRIKIYQIDRNRDENNLCFMDYTFVNKYGGVDASSYNMMYSGDVNAETLDDVYAIFNSYNQRPVSFMGRSLSVSDIVETKDGCFFCDSVGFKEIEFNASEAEIRYKEKMNVVILEPGKKARVGQVGCELEDMQAFVGGYIEVTYPFGEVPACIVCNEEGKLEGMPLNRALRLNMNKENRSDDIYDIIAGNAFICGLSGDGFCSLTKEEQQEFKQLFEKPEVFMKGPRGIEAIKVDEQVYSRAIRHS